MNLRAVTSASRCGRTSEPARVAAPFVLAPLDDVTKALLTNKLSLYYDYCPNTI